MTAPAIRAPRYDTADRPFIVIWEATRACPLACLHCRAEAIARRDPRELSTAEATDLLAVDTFGTPCPLFVITGGDPFQRPDLMELVERFAARGIPVAVSPSGTPTLTADNLRRLYDAGAHAISLSLDGSTARIHDTFRGVDGVYDQTLDAWRTAREIGLKVQVNTTVTGHNLTDLPQLVRLVHQYGAIVWSAFLLVPTGRGRQLAQLDPTDVEDVLNFVYDAGEYISAKTTEAHHYRRVTLQRLALEQQGEDAVAVLGLGSRYRTLRTELDSLALPPRRARRPPMQINAGSGFVFVSHTGEVYPSGFLPFAAGNVRERPLTELYRQSPLFQAMREPDALKGRCGRCEFRRVCGGSHSRAYGMTGDLLAEEPWCSYQPGSFPYQDELAALLAH